MRHTLRDEVMSTDLFPTPQFAPVVGEPAWDLAILYPLQGNWTEEDYLRIALHENLLIEYTDGCVEVLQMPTIVHQLIVRFLLDSLRAFVEPHKLGVVLFAPLPVKLSPKAYREPDLIFNFTENHAAATKDYYEHADLVMDVVSAGERDRKRDYEEKRQDYAKAGIREYWIVDPFERRIAVLTLQGTQYLEHGVFADRASATSRLLAGFAVDVSAAFDAGKA
jgi:Uma2 family endonuclease